ncbi:phosphatidate cytidylyltransferase [candidate division TA06 bacterium]|uniref:Phosphatidate cytidylyltransferase n=1 Tax=candidate division TA06 bacterium TaxID=2250710 RepID=A0A933IAJ6_UNCT6|nr:phosphatidate cytidylyltransferase [candidate division TA06 bacterium]
MTESNKQEFRPAGRNIKDSFSKLGPRVLVAFLGIPLMLAAVYLGGWWLWALVLLISLLGLLEYYGLASVKGYAPLKWWGLLGGILLLLSFSLVSDLMAGLTVGWLLLLLGWTAIKARIENSLAGLAATIFGIIYVPGLLGHMILLRNYGQAPGFKLLTLAMALVWAGDTGAYFTGLIWGKRPLAPKISPQKSIEGLLGGALFTVTASVLLSLYWVKELGLWQALIIGLGVAFFGTLGDLFESLFKRDAGVKDSGNLLPGHGGVLDRFDSMMFALPFVYWYCRIFVLG